MNFYKNQLVLFALIILIKANPGLGQMMQNGLIVDINDPNISLFKRLAPDDGFSIYDRPNGNKIGLFSNHKVIVNNVELPFDMVRITQISYHNRAINYFERKDGYVRVITDTMSCWLSEDEIIKNNFKIREWQEFLISNKHNVLGYFANGLNLREGPSTDSKIIKTLKGFNLRIEPTNESNGLWTKVKVIKYKLDPCEGDLGGNIEYTLEGWIKIVDDKGLPNVWYEISC